MEIKLSDIRVRYWIKDNVELPSDFDFMEEREKEDYLYENNLLHREDGPAVIYPNGYKAWYLDGKWRKIDGPAIIYEDGTKWWCLNGIPVDGEIYQKIQSSSIEELLVYMINSEYKNYLSLIEYRLNL